MLVQSYCGFFWAYFLNFDCFSLQGECQVGLRDNGDSSAFLFGALLFNKGTFIFDMDNNRIGLAEMK